MKTLLTSIVLAIVGLFLGSFTAPHLFDWLTTATFRAGFDAVVWTIIYEKFALGTAALFAAQAWIARIAHRSTSSAAIITYLLIAIIGSAAAANFWKGKLIILLENAVRWQSVSIPYELPYVAILFTGLICSLCAALIYRFRDVLFQRPSVRYDY
jgi:hypothetical protein